MIGGNTADAASAFFHGWLGGTSRFFPGARSEILAEIEHEFSHQPDPANPDDLWDVGSLAWRMSSRCSCSSFAAGYGCEHETALEAIGPDWLDECVKSHIDSGACGNCDEFVWAVPVGARR